MGVIQNRNNHFFIVIDNIPNTSTNDQWPIEEMLQLAVCLDDEFI
jgi:hypothetical protein